MHLGAFSISLNVKDLEASKKFYEALGFSAFAGTKEHRYYIMKNGNALVGLFQGMFEGNMLTFNPGWDESAQTIPGFTDVREIEKKLMAAGFSPVTRVEAGPSGPAHFVISDPDGNVILIDQHV